MSEAPIQLKISAYDDEVAYLYLPAHPKKLIPGIVKRQVTLSEIVKNYNGPNIRARSRTFFELLYPFNLKMQVSTTENYP